MRRCRTHHDVRAESEDGEVARGAVDHMLLQQVAHEPEEERQRQQKPKGRSEVELRGK